MKQQLKTLQQESQLTLADLAERVAYFRNREQISARELSLLIGKHESYINKLENTDFNFSARTLLEIINTLNVPIEEFFAPDFKTYREDTELQTIIKNLSLAQRVCLIEFLKSR